MICFEIFNCLWILKVDLLWFFALNVPLNFRGKVSFFSMLWTRIYYMSVCSKIMLCTTRFTDRNGRKKTHLDILLWWNQQKYALVKPSKNFTRLIWIFDYLYNLSSFSWICYNSNMSCKVINPVQGLLLLFFYFCNTACGYCHLRMDHLIRVTKEVLMFFSVRIALTFGLAIVIVK